MNKKHLSILLAAAMCISATVPAGAWTEQEWREDQAWTSMQLEATYDYIDQMWARKWELQEQIASLDADLINIMAVIDVTNNDIAAKEEEIQRTAANLERAQNACDKQYESMKERIKYLYENGGDDAWFQMLLNSEDLSDLLNRAEYTQKMYEQDRANLETYSNTIVEVQNLQDQYETEKADLEEMKASLEQQEAELQYQIEVKRASSANCDDEIAYAQSLATEYANWLIYTQQVIEQLEAQRRAAEEAARQAAAAAAAAAAQEAAQQAAYTESDDGSGYTVSVASGSDDYSEVVYDEYGNVIDSGNTVYDYDYSSDGSTGSSIVDFATQFVGNPYVWGGTSLTNGADCSGFVQSVYSNFGIDLPRTSYEQEYAGYEVSYSDAQPGDLICYGSHVAIYMGDGQIVHASNSRDGIKISDDATYRTITSVRRLV